MKSPNLQRITDLAQAASIFEVCSEKPGNVTPTHDFNDTAFDDYILGSLALGSGIADAAQQGFNAGSGKIQISDVGIGALIKKCITDIEYNNSAINTHLGIVMLLVPLAAAAGFCIAQDTRFKNGLRGNLGLIIKNTTVTDSENFYSAVSTANPGGLRGELKKPQVPFYEVMDISSGSDRVAKELSENLPIIFKEGFPLFNRVYNQLKQIRPSLTQTYLTLLSEYPDTHIIKKTETERYAEEASARAEHSLRLGGVFTEEGRKAASDLDRYLRDEDNLLNPGTTADLSCATLYVWLLMKAY